MVDPGDAIASKSSRFGWGASESSLAHARERLLTERPEEPRRQRGRQRTMQSRNNVHTEPRPRKRLAFALGAAAITVPLVFTPTAALAVPYAPVDGIEAIRTATYLPDYLQEFADQVDDAAVYEHVRHLAVDIGPRVAATTAEATANAYVQSTLDSYGFTTELEAVTVGVSTFANVVPDRDLPTQVSWQYRPASNALFTEAAAPVAAQVVDIGDGSTFAPADVAGKFVLVTFGGSAASRSAQLTALAGAGAAGVIFTNTNAHQSMANPGTVPAEATGIQVVGASLGQGQRVRDLLATGPLTLSITTERSGTQSSNVIGVRPAVGDTDGTAPIVYIGAHVDSVVGSPGASDNASGIGIMLESARILSQYSLDTEIRVGAWGAEEKGILGSKAHAQSLTPEEIDRAVGAWNMDMAGTAYAGTAERPMQFWGLSLKPEGMQNSVLNHADALSEHTNRGPLNRGNVARSDHESFQNVGIDAAVFSWMFWSADSSIVLEPTYHQTSDTIENVSQERMGISAEIIGGSAFRASLNSVTVDVQDDTGAAAAGVPVAMSCGADEGWREVGTTASDGSVTTLAPETECDFAALAPNDAIGGALDQAISGDTSVQLKLINDTTPPTVTLDTSAEANAAGWYQGPVEVSLAGADDIDQAPTVEFSRNGTDWEGYTAPITLADEGVNTLHARVTDGSGTTTPVERSYPIDTVAPTLTAAVDTGASAQRGDVTVAASDATSGVDKIEYRMLPDGEWGSLLGAGGSAGAGAAAAGATPAAADETLTAELPLGAAAATAEIRAVDVAGHASATVTLEFAADESVKPEPKPEPEPSPKPTDTSTPPAKSLATTGGAAFLGTGVLAGLLLLVGGGAIAIAKRRRAGGASDSSA